MRDYIVTHVSKSVDLFIPRVVRCNAPVEAMRATVNDLGWSDRQIRLSPSSHDTAFGTSHWLINGGKHHRDALRVEHFYPTRWAHADRIARLRRDGSFIKMLRNTDLARTVAG